MASASIHSRRKLMGSVVAVPGTAGVASSVATQRASVSVSNDGTLLYSSGGSRYQLGWFGRDGTPRGTVGAIEQTSTGARKPMPLLQSPFSERHAQFSPDGRWLAFTSTENGREEVYVQRFPDATTRQIVSSAGGAYPRWRPGGMELFYRAPDGQLMSISARPGGSSVEFDPPSVVMRLVEAAGVHPYPYDVAADGRILALTSASGAVQD